MGGDQNNWPAVERHCTSGGITIFKDRMLGRSREQRNRRMPVRTCHGGMPGYPIPNIRSPNRGNRAGQRRTGARTPPRVLGTGYHHGRRSPAAAHALQRLVGSWCSTDNRVSGGRAYTTGAPDVGTERLLQSLEWQDATAMRVDRTTRPGANTSAGALMSGGQDRPSTKREAAS